MSKDLFLSKIKQGAINSWDKGVLPSLVGAQAILESGWESSNLSKKANNLFGVKAGADWHGEKYNIPTKEWSNGEFITVNADFRKYRTWDDSVEDHANFFTENDFRKENYKNLIGEKDYKKAVAAILKPMAKYGYATDPNYADKIVGIIEENKLFEWDKEAFNPKESDLKVNESPFVVMAKVEIANNLNLSLEKESTVAKVNQIYSKLI